MTHFLFILLSTAWAEGSQIRCDYKFMGMDTSSVVVTASAEGDFGTSAEVILSGKSHFESLAVETPAEGELLHAWLSKESAQNSIEMVIFKAPQKLGRSVLTNHHVPIGQEMWGDCTGL